MAINFFLLFCFLTTSSMAIDLLPQFPGETLFQGEGGAYYIWSASQFPYLSQAKLGAAKLVLRPRGFVIPHYSDATKMSIVTRGCGRIGILVANSQNQTILEAQRGDVIPVPLGALSWYYNPGECPNFEMVFLGETSQSYTPAQFDYFILAGTTGVIRGFSNEVVSRTYNFTPKEADKLVNSQTVTFIVKLPENQSLPEPNSDASDKKFSFNLENERPYLRVNRAGSITLATEENFPVLKNIGLSATLVKLLPDSLLTPQFTADASSQLIYVTKGYGRVEIVGLNGERVLDAHVQKGQLFLVPRFFVVAELAGRVGMAFISTFTSLVPKYSQFVGPTGFANREPPLVPQAALNVDPEFTKYLISKVKNGTVIVPPKN